mmetsp:Transcript_2274/g.7607  ORF Transcript_2274/g.7607 Transcript_2274/m.7607 type:complete len:236 (+) Transcript_2274:1012-1719(+)
MQIDKNVPDKLEAVPGDGKRQRGEVLCTPTGDYSLREEESPHCSAILRVLEKLSRIWQRLAKGAHSPAVIPPPLLPSPFGERDHPIEDLFRGVHFLIRLQLLPTVLIIRLEPVSIIFSSILFLLLTTRCLQSFSRIRIISPRTFLPILRLLAQPVLQNMHLPKRLVHFLTLCLGHGKFDARRRRWPTVNAVDLARQLYFGFVALLEKSGRCLRFYHHSTGEGWVFFEVVDDRLVT